MNNRDIAYYGLTDKINQFYKDSLEPRTTFNHLMKFITSERNILLAIKTISSNTGRNSPGVDKITFEDVMQYGQDELIKDIRNQIKHKNAGAFREVKIPKKNGKFRIINIANIIERISQQCILQCLEPICEARFEKNSYGFRPNLTTKHAFAKCVDVMWKAKHDWYVTDIDFSDFFDNIKVDIVLDRLRDSFGINDVTLLKTIKRLTGNKLCQGGVLSPILSNVFMHGLDRVLGEITKYHKERQTGKSTLWRQVTSGTWDNNRKKPYLRWTRYADDIRILTATEKDSTEVLNLIRQWCEMNSMPLNEEKTNTYYTKDKPEITFVGLKAVRLKDGVIFCPEDTTKVLKTLKEKYRLCRYNGNNPSQMVASYITLMAHYDICNNMDFLINAMDRWCNPTKRGGYKLNVECKLIKGEREYTFKVPNRDKEIILNLWYIRKQFKTSISYYLRNEYKTDWTHDVPRTDCLPYIEPMMNEDHNSKLMMYLPGLLHRQKFKCYVSGQILTPRMCDIHHKIPLSKGGKDMFTNLVLIDMNVHIALHSKNSSVYDDNSRFKSLKANL